MIKIAGTECTGTVGENIERFLEHNNLKVTLELSPGKAYDDGRVPDEDDKRFIAIHELSHVITGGEATFRAEEIAGIFTIVLAREGFHRESITERYNYDDITRLLKAGYREGFLEEFRRQLTEDLREQEGFDKRIPTCDISGRSDKEKTATTFYADATYETLTDEEIRFHIDRAEALDDALTKRLGRPLCQMGHKEILALDIAIFDDAIKDMLKAKPGDKGKKLPQVPDQGEDARFVDKLARSRPEFQRKR